jgi:hypothetical protein
MASPSPLIEHTKEHLIQQRRINICGLYLPPLLVAIVLGAVLIRQFSFSPVFAFLPVLALALWMGRAFRRAENTVETVTIAALIDEKTNSQERFLTLATLSPSETDSPFVALVRRQTEEKATAFSPQRVFPFSLDRRVLLTFFASALSLLVLFLLPLESAIVPSTSAILPDAQQEQSEKQRQEVEKLADFARSLMRDGKTPQEKTAGAQLLALAEQLKNPTIPPEEKQRLIEETKQRMEVPLPQILPFQLDFFAGKDDKEKSDQNNQSQRDGKQQDKNNKNPDPSQTQQQSAAGNQQQQEQKEQPGSQQGDKKSEQQKSQEAGGGIKFNQPKPEQQGEKRDQPGQDSGEQQQANQNQSPDSRTQGTDPNKPGNQDGPGQDPQKQGQGPQPNPQQPGQEKKGEGSTVGGRPGERFLKPGEQPGGFLTKDARFVKVRIPFGDAPQGEGENLTENYDRAQPKTPYSNVPLKEAPPDQVQAKQPVPLEYRTILK